MRDAIAIEWRRTPVKPLPMLALAAVAGFTTAGDGGGAGAIFAVALFDAMGRWFPSPDREATEDYLLVRGIATRRGLALRRLVLGLVPIGAALTIAAGLRAAGRGAPGAPLALVGLGAVDTYLIVAAIARAYRPGSAFLLFWVFAILALAFIFTFAVAFGREATVFGIATFFVAPLALARLFRAPADERSERRRPSRREDLRERGDRKPSRPLPALVATALRPALGRDPIATLLVFVAATGSFAVLTLGPLSTSAKPFSIWSFMVSSLIYLIGLTWAAVWGAGGWLRPGGGRAQVEWLLARPLMRATLASGGALASHLMLLLVVGIGFAAAAAVAAIRGKPAPPALLALAFGLLASLELGVGARAAVRAARAPVGLARVVFFLPCFVLPLLLALPRLEQGVRGERAVLAAWALDTAAPWIAAHVPLALLGLLAASALAHALAYRSFRSYEL